MSDAAVAQGPILRVDAGGTPLDLELNRGRTYHLVAASAAARRALVGQLIETGTAAVVPPDGGMIGNLKVWENLVLPIAYRGRPRYQEIEERAAALFAEFGIIGDAFESLCTALPDRLDRFEQRLAAFVRALLVEPEIMVYDSPFDGLDRADAERVPGFDRVFHRHFPFRTSVFVTADAAALPDVGAYRVFGR